MKRRYFLILGAALIAAWATYNVCTGQSIKVQNSKEKRIIDLDKATYPDTAFLGSRLYKSVKIIPLETNESCLIGDIDKIQVIDNYVLIMDASIAKSLYVFDREGRFIRKIGSVGQGPGEYVSISDFTVDRENKTVYIEDGRLPRIHKYDLATGKFIQTITLERSANAGSAYIHHFVHIGGNLYASSVFYNHSPNNFMLFTIDESSGKEKNNFLNVMEYSMGFSNVYGNNIPDRSFFSRENGDAIFVRPMMSHIIEIRKDGVFSLFELKGKNLLTPSDAKRLFETYSIKDIANRDPMAMFKINKYVQIPTYIEKGETIIMDMIIGMTCHRVVINKRTNEVCVYKSWFDDLLFRKKEGSRTFVFGCADSDGVYFRTSSRRSNGVPELQELYKAGALSPDVIGLEKIMELKDDDNPVLLYYEFKE